jgi:hypothetical protein
LLLSASNLSYNKNLIENLRNFQKMLDKSSDIRYNKDTMKIVVGNKIVRLCVEAVAKSR